MTSNLVSLKTLRENLIIALHMQLGVLNREGNFMTAAK